MAATCICNHHPHLSYSCLSAFIVSPTPPPHRHTPAYSCVYHTYLPPLFTEDKPSVSHIFDTLEYGPAPESPSVAHAWLDDHGRNFGHFINNQWVRPEGRKTYETHNPATGEKLASTTQGRATLFIFLTILQLPLSPSPPLPLTGSQEDVELAVGAARKAYETWSKLPGHVRARHMYSIARHVQKHARWVGLVGGA